VRAGGARGIIFDEIADFKLANNLIRANTLTINWGADRGIVVSKQSHPTLVFERFSRDDTLRLAVWVARAESKVVFTFLETDSAEFNDAIENLGLSPVASIPRNDDPDARARRLVPEILDTPDLVRALEYIDFVQSSIDANIETELLVNLRDATVDKISETHASESKILSILNGNLKYCEETGIQSYTNTNLYANTTISIGKTKISSAPMRIFWKQCNEGVLHFTGIKRFINANELKSVDFNAVSPIYSPELHKVAMELFLLAAIFEAFKAESPTEFITFINSEIEG